MLNKNKVLVGMSGGVDSSVVAALLVESGYEVVGFTITPFKIDKQCRITDNERLCCSYKGTMDAANVCQKLGIPHYFADSTKRFKEIIVDNFISEYMNGRTPNPCVICNPNIKWGELLEKADEIGAYYIASGHYSNVRYDETLNRYIISFGLDKTKDQSYVLWGLRQEQLARTLLPLGDMNKTETRERAEKFGLQVAHKPDSQEICFIPDNDYRRFIREAVPDIDSKIGEGNIVFEGKVIGKHKGYPFYTIGQRKGLGISYTEPLFVKKIYPESNIIEVALDHELLTRTLVAGKMNMIKFEKIDGSMDLQAKIRYKDTPEDAVCKNIGGGMVEIAFQNPKRAVTPGQSVVLYDGNDLVGGGIIV